MTGFVPTGCLSCVDALNESYRDMFGQTKAFTASQWTILFSKPDIWRTEKLDHKVTDRMKQALYNLQSQLFEGERIACCVGKDGLEDIKPAIFGSENISQILAENGQVKPDLVGLSRTFFIRTKDYERHEYPAVTAESEEIGTKKNKGGRWSTGRDAALIFWGMFPNGRVGNVPQWKSAMRDVNRQLERLGLETVKETAFKENVNKLSPKK